MNIIEAISDTNLFRPFLGSDLTSWRNWRTALRVVYGLPILPSCHDTITRCTGRAIARLPSDGFATALFITGRRSGKSRIAAVVGAHEAAIAGHESKLAKGERGIVAVCAPTREQSQIVKDYLRGVFEAPLLANEVSRETRDGFELNSGTRIAILAGDWRSVRGFTLLAAIVDEACFFGYDAECKVRSDTELVRALKPALATTGGKLICISSPYAKRGYCYTQWKRCFGNDEARTLVWNCPSTTMNPRLPQSVVDDAVAEDLQAAKSEYMGEFRDDISEFISRSIVEGLVVDGRMQLLPQPNTRYFAFVDLSGGRADDAALAIAHRSDRTVVIDLLKRYRPPFNPHEVVRFMADELRRFGLVAATGDHYSAEFVVRAFESCGVRYFQCAMPKSQLYAELLPRMRSGEIELIDDSVLVDQLAALERRTRSGGRDVIDHPAGGHDDLSNAVAGAATLAAGTIRRAGAILGSQNGRLRRLK